MEPCQTWSGGKHPEDEGKRLMKENNVQGSLGGGVVGALASPLRDSKLQLTAKTSTAHSALAQCTFAWADYFALYR